MSDKQIQQVLEIEKQSQEIHEKATREAQELPVLAEKEAQDLIAKAKAEAQDAARKIIAQAQALSNSKGMQPDHVKKVAKRENLGNKNLDKSSAYGLVRAIGK